MKIFLDKKRLQVVITAFLTSTLLFTQPSYANSEVDSQNTQLLGVASILGIGAAIPALIASFIKSGNASPSETATLKSITVTPANPTVAVGYTQQFTARGIYSDNSTRDITDQVTWSAGNNMVTLSSAGAATINGIGSTTIQATLSEVTAETTLTATEGGPIILSTSNHNLLSYNGSVATSTITIKNNSNTSQKINRVSPITVISDTCSQPIAPWGTCEFNLSYQNPGAKLSSKNSLPNSVAFGVKDDNGRSDAITINLVNKGVDDFFDPSIDDTKAVGLPYTPNTLIMVNKNGNSFLYASPNDKFYYDNNKNTQNGVFRSSDGGVSWAPINNGLTNLNVTTLYAIKDGSANTLYAGTSSGLFISKDYGESWQLNGFKDQRINFLYSIDGALYTGTGDYYNNGGVYESTDGGNSWHRIDGNQLGNAAMFTMCSIQDSSSHNTMYVASFSQDDYRFYIYQGTYDGANWIWTKTYNFWWTCVYSLYSANGYLYAGTVRGIFRSSDGITWEQNENSNNNYYVQSFCSINNVLYAGTFNAYSSSPPGVLKSGDGINWVPINNGLMGTNVLALYPNGNQLYAATDIGVFKRDINETGWTATGYMLTMQTVQSLCTLGSKLYAGIFGAGVFASTDGGANWIAANNGLTNLYVNTLISIGNDLYAGIDGSGVFVNSGGTSNWIAKGLANENVLDLYLDPTNNKLYAGLYGHGIVKSTDRGTNWVAVDQQGQNIMAFLANGDNLYAGTYSFDDNSVSYNGGFFTSSDGGATWSTDTLGMAIQALYSKTGTLYAGTANNGVYKSGDSGQTWELMPDTTDYGTVETFYSPNGSNRLYAGFGWGNGVYYLDPTSGTWTPTNLNSLSAYIFSSIDNGLYIGTDRGVYKTFT